MSISIRKLMEAGVHLGHRTAAWNPNARTFIHSARGGRHIIDLPETKRSLREACSFLRQSRRDNKTILFVGTKRRASEIIEAEARRCMVPYVNQKWVAGTLTNFEVIRERLDRLKALVWMFEMGEIFRCSKKEIADFFEERDDLEKHFGGIVDLKNRPDVLFVIDVSHESTAVREAVSQKIPIVGLVDTNSDPNNIDYVIPGNDDSTRSIRLVAGTIVDAILDIDPPDFDDETHGPDLNPSPVPKHPLPQDKSSEICISEPSSY